jgi:hypothetical protein
VGGWVIPVGPQEALWSAKGEGGVQLGVWRTQHRRDCRQCREPLVTVSRLRKALVLTDTQLEVGERVLVLLECGGV